MTITIAVVIGSALLALALAAVLPKKVNVNAGLILLAISSVAGIYLLSAFWGTGIQTYFIPWFQVGKMSWDFEIIIDAAAIMMLGLVSIIGTLVYWFSITYLKNDSGKTRYFILLVLFLLSMYGLVISANLFQLFIFWELVGFCSFGLIGFYFKKDYATKAAGKAFMVNRVADIFIVIGLGLIFQEYSSLSLSHISEGGQISWIAGLCLLIGASGKSAQYPFALWLPDAMAGPTPVSAFIHAATMVTAGIILIARIYFILPFDILTVMAFLGAITAFLAGITALVQHDIKKILAYSTISQLGYMFAGLGTGAWDAALFHLFTHAFFKAGLFLNAGAIILWMKQVNEEEQMSLDPQDMRNMGGLRKYTPIVFVSFTICTLALIGVPFFSGYLSKDAIISGAFAWAERSDNFLFYIVPDLTFITIVLTAIYMVRMWSLIFLGDQKLKKIFPHISLKIQKIGLGVKLPLIVLAILSVGFIVSINPLDVGNNWLMPGIREYLAFNPDLQAPGLPSDNHLFIAGTSVFLILLGGIFAWWRYKPTGNYHFNYARYEFRPFYLKMAYKHYFLNDTYNRAVSVFIQIGDVLKTFETKILDRIINWIGVGGVVTGHVIKFIDKYIVDGLINFSAFFAAGLGKILRKMASAHLQGQVVAAVLLLVLLLLIFMIN